MRKNPGCADFFAPFEHFKKWPCNCHKPQRFMTSTLSKINVLKGRCSVSRGKLGLWNNYQNSMINKEVVRSFKPKIYFS